MKVQTRECVRTSLADGCYTSDEDVNEIFNDVLSSLTGVELDGKVCYCSEDLCDAACGGNYWLVGGWWSVLCIHPLTLSPPEPSAAARLIGNRVSGSWCGKG